jgi:L-iditol 2-dehydrogenase
MKVAALVAAGRFEVQQLPDPVAPDDGLVLRVEACGVCGSDLRRWKEGPPKGVEGLVPGHEVAGVVVQVGPRCRWGASRAGASPAPKVAVGDRLALAPDVHCGRCYYCRRGLYNLCDDLRLVGITPGYPGGFAEQMAVSAEVLANGIVHRMPDGLSFAHAALAEPCSSVLAAHHKAGTSLSDVVVIMGAGPIGCLHVAVAKARGAVTVVSEPSAPRRAMAERFQPEAIVDPFSEDLAARVRRMTGGLGADIVICANPVADTQTQAVEIVRKGGRVILFGGLPKAAPTVSFDANRIHYGEIQVAGAFSYHPSFHELALDLLSRNALPADLLITHTVPLDRVQEAFEVAAGGNALKVLVEA